MVVLEVEGVVVYVVVLEVVYVVAVVYVVVLEV